MSGSNAAVEGLSGALGGVLALLSTYPLMTVRLSAPEAKEQEATTGDTLHFHDSSQMCTLVTALLAEGRRCVFMSENIAIFC